MFSTKYLKWKCARPISFSCVCRMLVLYGCYYYWTLIIRMYKFLYKEANKRKKTKRKDKDEEVLKRAKRDWLNSAMILEKFCSCVKHFQLQSELFGLVVWNLSVSLRMSHVAFYECVPLFQVIYRNIIES